MTWEILLGSAVIAASISGIVAIVTSRKANNLQYITGERKEWREEIREIAEELHGAKYKQTLKILTKLKVRINGCGNSVNSIYLEDSHIWELIKLIEGDRRYFKKRKQVWIEYLSILLKHDWERAKREVSGDKNRIWAVILYVLAGVYFLFSCYIKQIETNNPENNLSLAFLMLTTIAFFNWSVIESNVEEYKKRKNNDKTPNLIAQFSKAWLTVFVMLMVIILWLFAVGIVRGLINIWPAMTCILIYVIGGFFNFISQIHAVHWNDNYNKLMQEIRMKYKDVLGEENESEKHKGDTCSGEDKS